MMCFRFCRLVSTKNPFVNFLKMFFRGVFITGFAVITSCGIPDYIAIEAPIGASTDPSLSVAFTTPADDLYIDGYIVYYKIYTGDSDRSDTGEADATKFSSESAYSNNEIPIGEAVPKAQGYFRMGKVGENDFNEPTIIHTDVGANTTVTIEFDFDTEEVNASVNATSIEKLARGIVDYRRSGEPFRSFYADWSISSTPDTGWTDSDLRRNTGSSGFLQYQPVDNEDDYNSIKKISTSLEESASLSDGNEIIQIGIAIHAVGKDPATLQPLYSSPVHLGFIETNSQLRPVDRQ